jgi:hypothetical protein
MPTNEDIDRAVTILIYINSITLSGRTLMYPSSSGAEEQAVKWLIDDNINTKVDDEQAMRQRYALSTVWFLQTPTPFGTDGHKETWTTNIDECNWLGLVCNDRGRVTALLLGEVNARGQIPDDLGLLTDLTSLWLFGNRLTGTIPSSLGLMTALENLWLSTNTLTGTIPSSIGDLKALTALHLWSNQLRGTIPSSIQTLTALDALGLSSNELIGTIPSSLAALTALTMLDLDGNALTGTIPPSFDALTALTRSWLYDNRLVGMVPFCNSNNNFTSLVADCAALSCTCCTGCCPTAFEDIPVFYRCA